MPCGSVGGHFVCWHTGDGETLDLTVKLTPVLDNLVHDAIVLTLHALGSLALAFLTEIHDRLHCILRVDLDLVVRVLDDGDGHGVVSLADEYSIGLNGTCAREPVPLLQLSPASHSHQSCSSLSRIVVALT